MSEFYQVLGTPKFLYNIIYLYAPTTNVVQCSTLRIEVLIGTDCSLSHSPVTFTFNIRTSSRLIIVKYGPTIKYKKYTTTTLKEDGMRRR